MMTLKQIKEKDFMDKEMSNLEKIICDFLTPEISMEAINQAKGLSIEEIDVMIQNYLDSSTAKLFESILTLNNVIVFLKSQNSDIIKMAEDFLYSQSQIQNISGKLNLKNLKFNCDEQTKNILINLNKFVDISEIMDFVDQLEIIGESIDMIVDVKVVKNHSGFKMILGHEVNKKEEINWWKEKLVTGLKVATVCSALFPGVVSAGETDEAIRSAMKAASHTQQVKEMKEVLNKKAKEIEENAKNVLAATGTEVPAAIVGVGLKSAIEQKVEFKGKLSDIGANAINYDVSVGFDNTYRLGVGGKNPYMKDSNYKIETLKRNKEQVIQMKLDFDF